MKQPSKPNSDFVWISDVGMADDRLADDFLNNPMNKQQPKLDFKGRLLEWLCLSTF